MIFAIVFRNIFCHGLSPVTTLAVDCVVGFFSYAFFSMVFYRKLVMGAFHVCLGYKGLNL
jgi:hypothetical protein